MVSIGDWERSFTMVRMGDFTDSGVAALDISMALFENLGGGVLGTSVALFETSMALLENLGGGVFGISLALFDASMALLEKSDDCVFAVAVGFRMRRDGRTGADESVRVAAASGAGREFEGTDVETLGCVTAVLSLLIGTDVETLGCVTAILSLLIDFAVEALGCVTAAWSLLIDADDDLRDQGSGADVFSAFAACRLAAMASLMLCFGLGATDLAAAAVAALAGAGAVAVSALSLMRTLR